MTATFYVGDAIEVMSKLPEKSVDLILTSPPFLALRSYLPADHPDKALEGGSQATPGEYIDWLIDVVEACDRVLAPHGSMCIELGDTYAGSGGGGDYLEGGWREGQAQFAGSAASMKESNAAHWRQKNPPKTRQRNDGGQYGNHPQGGTKHNLDIRPVKGSTGWPLAKSLSLIPELFRLTLVYGTNPLTGRQTERWRLRNVVRWCLDGDTVVYARTPKGVGPVRLLHLTQNWQPGQWDLWDGNRWTPVLGWSTTETDDAVEIEFRNGEKVSATRNHQWPTQRGLVSTDELRIGDVVTHTTLPDSPGEPDHLPDDDIGWLIGTFLADGSFDSRDRMQIAGHRDEGEARHTRLTRIARAYDGTASRYEHGTGLEGNVVVRSYVLAAIVRRYVGGNGARNKHLLPATWRRSNRFLTAVLQAYLEGDGHYDVKNDRWRLGFTDNMWLARDLRTIAARLGVVCRIKRQPRAKDPRGGQFAGAAHFLHRGEIRLLPGVKVSPPGQVVALRQSKRRRFFDVGVEGEPHLFALASGILTHNCRPNPPVGALGDKWRPATSELMVFCKSAKRFFDLDATREPWKPTGMGTSGHGDYYGSSEGVGKGRSQEDMARRGQSLQIKVDTHGGAPPLDWWKIPQPSTLRRPCEHGRYDAHPTDWRVFKTDCPGGEFLDSAWTIPLPERTTNDSMASDNRVPNPGRRSSDHLGVVPRAEETVNAPLDWWNIPPGGFSGAHYAVWPPELLIKPIKAMCPEKVCLQCGEPSRRITEPTPEYGQLLGKGYVDHAFDAYRGLNKQGVTTTAERVTTGFSDCGHDDWRPGLVLDPFGGSGTTALVATGHGRDCWLIDLDERNYELALQRVGPFILERAG